MLIVRTAAACTPPTLQSSSAIEYNELTCSPYLDPKESPNIDHSGRIPKDTTHGGVKHCNVAPRGSNADSEWKTTSPSLVMRSTPFDSRIQPALVSCLRKSSRQSRSSSGRRLIRGLWNPRCCCLFSHLHNDLMLNMFSFLNMKDTITASQVCQRWKLCTESATLWENVEATEFVQVTFQQQLVDCRNSTKDDAKQATSQGLLHYLKPHLSTMKSLAIRSIGHALDASTFLPTLTSSLRELTLTGYANLSDTHVHVMFLSCKGSALQKLILDECPLLTNATVESLARHCASLKELSVKGCPNITSNLNDALLMQQQCRKNMRRQVSRKTITSLQSLFAPP